MKSKIKWFSLIKINIILKEEILFNQNFTIKFAEVIDLKLNLTDLILPNSISYETKSFLNIITKVEKPKNCDNSRSVNYNKI